MSQGASLICAAIGRTRHKMMQIEIQEAAKRGARLIELRLDFLAKAPDFKRLLAGKPCPLIATVRRAQDGGRWGGTEEERLMLLRQAIVAGFDYVDLETDVADGIRRFGAVKRIISYHNLRNTPADLDELYEKMCGQDPDIVKIAVTAQQPEDNLRVLDLVRKQTKPTIAHCMGDLGTCSRVLGARFGAPFTYAAFNKERSLAPGIFSYEDLKRVYQYEDITSDADIFGVIGDPVAHSLSPLIHNRSFRDEKVNAVYVPFRVPRGELVGFECKEGRVGAQVIRHGAEPLAKGSVDVQDRAASKAHLAQHVPQTGRDARVRRQDIRLTLVAIVLVAAALAGVAVPDLARQVPAALAEQVQVRERSGMRHAAVFRDRVEERARRPRTRPGQHRDFVRRARSVLLFELVQDLQAAEVRFVVGELIAGAHGRQRRRGLQIDPVPG